MASPKSGANAPLLDEYLHQLRLPTFAHNWQSFAQDATKSGCPYDSYLMALAEFEIAHREKNRHVLRIKAARFPSLKELADFDFALVPSLNKTAILELARGDYLTNVENVILVGNPGLGKTHVGIGLALAACRQGQRVRFYNAATLVNELLSAQDQHQTERFIAAARKHRLIVLDELGFIPFTPSGAQLLFQFCSSLHDHVALIITTNLKFADWVQVFGSDTLTAALLDRLTHRAHILEFSGAESFRFKQRLKRQSKGGESANSRTT
jgi:DNA replication protein DnaC